MQTMEDDYPLAAREAQEKHKRSTDFLDTEATSSNSLVSRSLGEAWGEAWEDTSKVFRNRYGKPVTSTHTQFARPAATIT